MNNLQQAAKQALEALEKCRDWPGAYDECSLALHDLRAALAEPEQKPIAWLLDDTHHVEFHQQCYHESPWWTPLYTAPTPQPEQEPVAHSVVEPLRPDEYQCRVSVKWVGQPVSGPLYTAPTPRKPLTDEEIDRVIDQQWGQGDRVPNYAAHRAYARAIERAHGIGEQHE